MISFRNVLSIGIFAGTLASTTPLFALRLWIFGGSALSNKIATTNEYSLSKSSDLTVAPGVTTPVTTAGTVMFDDNAKNIKTAVMGIHVVMPFGLGLGLSSLTAKGTQTYSAKTDIATTSDLSKATLAVLAKQDTLLATEELKAAITYLDVSYTLPIPFVLVNAGLGMGIASTSSYAFTYGTEATTILTSLSGAAVGPETLHAKKGGSSIAYFLNVGYSILLVDVMLGYRSVTTKTTVDLSTSPLRYVAGADSLASTMTSNFVTLTLGIHI